jgi:hypothetical protein
MRRETETRRETEMERGDGERGEETEIGMKIYLIQYTCT